MRSPADVRLFLALWPTDPVRQAIVGWQSQWQWPDKASVVKPERLHVTLHFLGDVPPERIRDIKYVMQPIRAQNFELNFTRTDTWQHGAVVIRPENSPTALRGLHGRIGLALAEIAVKTEERSYRPHVTLARRAAGATPPAQPPDVMWQAKDGFVLVQTLSGGRGYEILERFGA
ncbi:MAG TPA: RNA 2',3'-cyclic phosphodiesterase [Ramlibacter sp.]|nr:RNA 2',3'-cyclic phosphodiesterase [Ramlibacter sp.]